MSPPIGKRRWAIAEGYIPTGSTGAKPELLSHETICILNASAEPANINIMVYFADRKPVGPYSFQIPPKRTRHLRFNEFSDPEPIPTGTDYASAIDSDVPIVVQHTRLDSRQAENALLTTIAYGQDV